MRSHINEGAIYVRRQQRRGWIKEFAVILGSALLGAFVQGVVTELSGAAVKPAAVAAYIAMGFFGVVIVVVALWTSR
jgi:hypothetical protein